MPTSRAANLNDDLLTTLGELNASPHAGAVRQQAHQDGGEHFQLDRGHRYFAIPKHRDRRRQFGTGGRPLRPHHFCCEDPIQRNTSVVQFINQTEGGL